jgi:endonuclease IV
MKQSIETITHDIKVYNYWVDEFKKELRVAKNYGWHINEIKQAGNNIKRYRLKIKLLQASLNTINN